jgi:hypothetical protein
LKFKNCFKMFKTKNNHWILKVLPNSNRKFVSLNKKIKLSAVSQIINNKGSKQQKWGQNNHIKIVFVLPLWMKNLLSGLQLICLLEIFNGIRPQHRNTRIIIVNLIICPKRLPPST